MISWPTWWIILSRGIITMLFGLIAFTLPRVGLTFLVITFGIYMLVDGLFAFWVAGTRRFASWSAVTEALLGIGFGMAAFIWPRISAEILITLIAVWILSSGLIRLGGIFFAKKTTVSFLNISYTLLAILFGIALVLLPGFGAILLTQVLGIYLALSGVVQVLHAYNSRAVAMQSPHR